MPNKISRVTEYGCFRGFITNGMFFDLSGDQNVRMVDISGLDGSGSGNVIFNGCTRLLSIVADNLVSIGDISISSCDLLSHIALRGCPLLEPVVENLPALERLYIGSSQCTSISIAGCGALEVVHAAACEDLTALSLSGSHSIYDLDASGCALSEASVDAILASLDANGVEEGNIDLSGGTNAVPSAAGLASKASLEGKDWLVVVNS